MVGSRVTTPASLGAPHAWRMGVRVGVDPGSKATGVIGAFGGTVAFAQVVSREDAKAAPWEDGTLTELEDTIADAYTATMKAATEAKYVVEHDGQHRQLWTSVPPVLAVEQITRPTGFPKGGTRDGRRQWPDPWPLMISTALVATALAMGHRYPHAKVVSVAPKGNGHSEYRHYPEALIAKTERRGNDWPVRPAGQSNVIRHCRSAWDVATVGWMDMAHNYDGALYLN